MTGTAWAISGREKQQLTWTGWSFQHQLTHRFCTQMNDAAITEKTLIAMITATIQICFDMAKKTRQSFAIIINSCTMTDGYFYPSFKCWKSAWYIVRSFSVQNVYQPTLIFHLSEQKIMGNKPINVVQSTLHVVEKLIVAEMFCKTALKFSWN